MEGPDATRRLDDIAAQIVCAILAAAGGKPPSDWRRMRVDYSEQWHKKSQIKQVAEKKDLDNLKAQALAVLENARKGAAGKKGRKK